jgi:uncharacterized SAM-binding protein YcdF (DUF218 family)
MYYLAAAFLRPLALAYGAVALALILVWRRRDRRRRLIALSVALGLVLVLSLPVTSYLALGTLEWAYPPMGQRPADAPVIVVLSGSLRPADAEGSHYEPGTDTLYRCLRAAEVYRDSPSPVLVSGGKVHDDQPGPALAVVMRDFLLTQGVRPEDVIVEDASRSTYENAVQCARLLGEKGVHRVVLVTDAAHMRRAEGCFRKQGLDVVHCSCRYRATRRNIGPGDFLPEASAVVGVDEAAHEWLGLAWYWLTGKL